MVANAGRVAGAALNAVIAAEALDENAEAPANATDVPFAVRNTDALVGVAVNAVRAELAVANDDAADRVPEAMFVTALAVSDDPAFAPQTDRVQLVLCAAHDSKCPNTYSPAESDVAPNVNGWTLFPAHPCCNVLAVPDDDVPEAHDTARDALRTVARDVLLANE